MPAETVMEVVYVCVMYSTPMRASGSGAGALPGIGAPAVVHWSEHVGPTSSTACTVHRAGRTLACG